MGGYSSEFEISLKSGNVVYKYLDKEKFDSYRIHIFKNKWVYVDDNEKEFPVNRDDFSIQVNGESIHFDCVFNAIHGTPGEDGLMQAYFELLQIPQTSCDYYQSALTFNKRDLLSVLKPYGIPSATSYYLNLGDNIDEEAIKVLKEPTYNSIMKVAIDYSDAIIEGSQELPKDIQEHLKASGKPVLDYKTPEEFAEPYTEFYNDSVLSS